MINYCTMAWSNLSFPLMAGQFVRLDGSVAVTNRERVQIHYLWTDYNSRPHDIGGSRVGD